MKKEVLKNLLPMDIQFFAEPGGRVHGKRRACPERPRNRLWRNFWLAEIE